MTNKRLNGLAMMFVRYIYKSCIRPVMEYSSVHGLE